MKIKIKYINLRIFVKIYNNRINLKNWKNLIVNFQIIKQKYNNFSWLKN